MEWFSFSDIPWLAVALAFVASFIIGWFWYSPQGFFKPWQKAVGFTDEDMKNANMGLAFGGTVLGNLMGIVLLAVLLLALGVDSWGPGALTGAILGIGFRWGAHLLHDGFAIRKPISTVIDGAHDTLALAVSGAILGAFL